MADSDLFDFSDPQTVNLFTGGGLGGSADDPYSAYAYSPSGGGGQGAPAASQAGPPPSGLSSLLPSWLGGPQTAAPSAAGLGTNTLIGTGLGLLAGNRFDPYGRAAAGFASGAAADLNTRKALLAEQQARELNQYRQQELGLRREQMAQTRELALRPQIHYGSYEDPQSGLVTPFASMFNPATQRVTPVPLDVANKMARQPGVDITLTDPFGNPYKVPPGANPKTLRQEFDRVRADIVSGRVSPDQARAQLSASQMELAEQALTKDDLDKQGTEQKGRLLEAAPGGALGATIANRAQNKQYRDFADNRDAFITGLMTRRGLNAANEGQRREYDRMYFPQPQDDDATIEAKRQRRTEAIKEVRAAASPGYRGQQQQPQASPSDQFTGRTAKGPAGKIRERTDGTWVDSKGNVVQ